MYIYDSTTNAFFPVSLKDDYVKSGIWPDNGVEIDEDTFSLFQNPPPGKMRIVGSDGKPAWGDIPLPTREQQISAANAEKKFRVDSANDYINSKQWPGKAARGKLTQTEGQQYDLWLDYLNALEAVDTSAEDVIWPEPPAV